MQNNWRQSAGARVIFVLLTIIFLAGAGLSLIALALRLSYNNKWDYCGEMEAYTAYSFSRDDFLYNAVYRTRYGETSQLVELLKERYSREDTNWRYALIDPDGNVVGTNAEAGELSAANTFTFTQIAEQYQYRKPVHLEPQFATNLWTEQIPSYLDDPQEFSYWYYTDNRMDTLAKNGVNVLESQRSSEYVNFSSLEEAKNYPYKERYGNDVSWSIVGGEQNGDETFVTGMPAAVVTVLVEFNEQMNVPLREYYEAYSIGQPYTPVSEEDKQLLMGGVDIVIIGNHAETESYEMRLALAEGLPVQDSIRSNYETFCLFYRNAEQFAIALFCFTAATVIAAIAMCSCAGHINSTEGVVATSVHRLPYGLFWALPVAAAAASALLLWTIHNTIGIWRMTMIFMVGLSLAVSACCVLWLYTTAVRIKTRTFWSSFGAVRLIRACFMLMHHKTLTCILTAISMTALMIFNGIAVSAGLVLPAIGIDLLTLLFVLYCVYSYFTLHQHLVQMTLGNFEPERYALPLSGDFARFDRELNCLTDNVSEMVDQRMKAERLRTELITNVSHDLKTPLTSIVNYVDLLSREPMQTAESQEYLEVLQRQAARLRKLTLDLVDASKASSGSLAVELLPMGVQVLLAQAAGEYEERLAARGLSFVCNIPEEQLYILADSRQIWRVLDNLLNNVCKYALSGTRVYLDVEAGEETVMLSVKNVSAAPLNVSPEELMERFVRGDTSRHTEGSGLGLSIARDLVKLQGGTMILQTDGDLFKAILTFPRFAYDPDLLTYGGTHFDL